MSVDWLKLYASGELADVASKCDTRGQFAAHFGLSEEGARKQMSRAGVPAFSALKFGSSERRASGTAHNDDFADEERTQERVPVFDVSDAFPSGKIDGENGETSRAGMPTPADHLAARKERTQVADLKSQLKDALDALERCQYERDTAIGVIEIKESTHRIKPRERTSELREATAVALASDWHIEERVDSAAVNGVNEFNLEIARRRVERYFEGLAYLIKYHRGHFAIRDLLLWLGGDLITGYLREENLEHNTLSPVQAIADLHGWIEPGIRHVLAECPEIEHGDVVCNSGNHGRLTEKVRPSTREANSIEWLLYAMLARTFADEPRISFTLPKGSQTYVDVYDWTIRFTHGDETKFGGGVGGIMIPVRKAIAKWQTVRHAHLTCIGHYHQEHFLRDLVVNGSLVGYGPYSLSIAAPFEEPRQSFFLMDKNRGITMPSTIWLEESRKVRAA